MNNELKQAIYQQCLALTGEKISALTKTLNDLKESIAGDTKSTAGDKHETARAHLQIEQEQTGRQLREVLDQRALLEQIHINAPVVAVVKGSLVETDKGFFFVATGLGKVVAAGKTVFVLSPQSPLGMALMGKHPGDTVSINQTSYVIRSVV